MRTFLPLLVALALPLAAHGEMYKWVDDNGKVHYSDQPPVGTKAKSVEPAKAKAESAGKTTEQGKDAKPKSLADKEMEFNKRRTAAKEAAAKKEAEDAQAKQNQENCERARTYLRSLESGERLASPNEKGERVIMDDARRQSEIPRAKKDVETYCK